MENTIVLNSGQKIEVLMQDEVSLDIDCSLRYIKSGQKEVADYVKGVARPQLDNVIVQAKSDMAAQIAQGVKDAAQAAVVSAEETIDAEAGKASAAFQANAAEKISEFNSVVQNKTDVFNQNAAAKQQAIETTAAEASQASNAACASAEAASNSAQAASSSAAASLNWAEKAYASANSINNGFNLFDVKWSDHAQNDVSWLKSDNFSWASGAVYTAAYNKLVTEYNDEASMSQTDEYGDFSITCKVSPGGYKIADVSQETAIMDLYAATGVAWYYILDTENARFKLPRMSFPEHGHLIKSYKNGDNWYRVYSDGWCEQGGLTNTATGINAVTFLIPYIDTDYSAQISLKGGLNSYPYAFTVLSKTMYGMTLDQDNGANLKLWTTAGYVTQPIEIACGKRLYFYVGDFAKTSLQQTAGLNAENFNAKADTDLNNVDANIDYVVESFKEGEDWYRIYKSGWIEQGGAIPAGTDSEYTIELHKEMADLAYQCCYRGCGANSASTAIPWWTSKIYPLSTAQVQCIRINFVRKWYVCGQMKMENDNE